MQNAPTTHDNPAPETMWLKLAAYGDFPHTQGMQRFSRQSAARLVRYFNSLRGRFSRKFGGLPVYIGHPDDPAYSGKPGHGDTRAHAWIHAMQDRDDGLYILPRWSDSGREILHNAHYKFLSPRWLTKPLGKSLYEPVRLLSVGLTNLPNIPGEAIANAIPIGHSPDHKQTTHNSSIQKTIMKDKKLLERLGMALDATEEEVLDSIVALANERDELKQETESNYGLAESARQQADTLKEENTNLRDTFANERAARIELMIGQAEHEARIAPHERGAWTQRLQSAFEESATALSNAIPILPTSSITKSLGAHRDHICKQRRFLDAVNDRVSRTGEAFATAWANTKRERNDLFLELSN